MNLNRRSSNVAGQGNKCSTQVHGQRTCTELHWTDSLTKESTKMRTMQSNAKTSLSHTLLPLSFSLSRFPLSLSFVHFMKDVPSSWWRKKNFFASPLKKNETKNEWVREDVRATRDIKNDIKNVKKYKDRRKVPTLGLNIAIEYENKQRKQNKKLKSKKEKEKSGMLE